MFEKGKNFIKNHLEEIILIAGIILVSLFSFALGYIVAKQEEKKPIKIEYESSNHWRISHWSLFGLETCTKG
jgi:hypothetical protein